MDHLKKAGELLGASSRSFNIASSIEAAVDIAARQAAGLAALPTLITSVNQGVQRVFEHWRAAGEIMGAEEFNIAENIRSAVDAQVRLSAPGYIASMSSVLTPKTSTSASYNTTNSPVNINNYIYNQMDQAQLQYMMDNTLNRAGLGLA
jgi:hypothetical protein